MSMPAPLGPGLGLAPPSVKIRESVARMLVECINERNAAKLRLFRILGGPLERVDR